MKRFLFAFVAMIGGLVVAPVAQAAFLFVDIFDGTTLLQVQDQSALDDDPLLNSVNVNSALVATFGAKLASGSNVTSSSNQTTALGDGFSRLVTAYTLTGKVALTSDFTITSYQTGFVVPGDPKQVNTFTSVTYTNGAALSSVQSQGSIGTPNVDPFGVPTLFDSAVGPIVSGPGLVSGGAAAGNGFIFSNGNSAYSMQNSIDARLVSTDAAGAVTIAGSTTNIVVPANVPEPSTIVMLATFVGPLTIGAYRRHRRSAK
jgi:hypothetical protein